MQTTAVHIIYDNNDLHMLQDTTPKHTYRHTDEQTTNGSTGEQTDKQTYRHTDGQNITQTDRQNKNVKVEKEDIEQLHCVERVKTKYI